MQITSQISKNLSKQQSFNNSPIVKSGSSTAGLSYLAKQVAKDPVVQSWADWLDQREWQLFTTLTTARELTLPGARRSINKLAAYLAQNKYPAEIFWAAEPFDCKEGYHLHSLIRFTDLSVTDNNQQHYKSLIDGWRQITADKAARIFSERYQPKKGANSYIGKYITKHRSDYDLIAEFLPGEDQKEHPETYQALLAERLELKKKLNQAYKKKQCIYNSLREIGIDSAIKPVDKPIYSNTNITFEQWEKEQYRLDAVARLEYPNKIGKPAFSITAIASS